MKRVLMSVALLFIGAAVSAPAAMASGLSGNSNNSGNNCGCNTSTSNNSSSSGNSSSCDMGSSGNFPAAYTGGASVVKVFHLDDGSTVTITSTGAVIKQGRCGNPYREGWLNPANICNVNSAQDINGQLSFGSTSPFGGKGFSSCSTNTQQTSNSQPTQTQTQSQSQTVNVLAATTTKAKPSSSQTQQQAQSTPAAGKGSLPNTGPGDVAAIGAAAAILATIGHYMFSRRRYFFSK